MGMFDWLYKKEKPMVEQSSVKDLGEPNIKEAPVEPDNFTKEEAKAAVKKATKKKKSPKEIATEKGEPWVNILGMDIDPEDINSGAFELDWNDKFIAQLARHGYVGKTDSEMVDQWFQNVCRNVVLEVYEQAAADISQPESPARFHQKKDLGDGRSEIS